MIINTKPNRPGTIAVGLAFLGLVMCSHALADNYRVKIKRVTTESVSGDVIIQVKPGTNEEAFSGRARVMLLGSDPGTNRTLANLLTAIALKADVFINVTNPPTYDDIQVINKTTLIAP